MTQTLSVRLFSCTALIGLLSLAALNSTMPPMLHAQQADASAPTAQAAPWQSSDAAVLIGLPDVKDDTKGSLSITPGALVFTAPDLHASIRRDQIFSVAVDDQTEETGGAVGRISRLVIPFGGGSALATVTHRQIGLLTVEFRDARKGLHGAVFMLPKVEAAQARQQLGSQTALMAADEHETSCETDVLAHPNTIQVAPIASSAEPFPADYRMLMYEQLVQQLRDSRVFAGVYREGDDAAGAVCSEYHLTLTLIAFKKGNAVLRASTGPVGFFVGTTSITLHALVRDANGTTLLDKDFKVSKRGDTASLDIAEKVAEDLTKDLKKARKSSIHA